MVRNLIASCAYTAWIDHLFYIGGTSYITSSYKDRDEKDWLDVYIPWFNTAAKI